MFKNALFRWQRVFDREWKLIPGHRTTVFKSAFTRTSIKFRWSKVTLNTTRGTIR